MPLTQSSVWQMSQQIDFSEHSQTTKAKQNKSRLTKCWMKWRNRARRLLQMIVLVHSISSLPPSFSLNLFPSLLYPPPPQLPSFSSLFSCFLWFVPQTHIDPRALDPVGGLVPPHRSTAHDWRSPYGRRRRRCREGRDGGRERVRVSQWKQSSLEFREEGDGAECDSWSMVLLQLHSN